MGKSDSTDTQKSQAGPRDATPSSPRRPTVLARSDTRGAPDPEFHRGETTEKEMARRRRRSQLLRSLNRARTIVGGR